MRKTLVRSLLTAPLLFAVPAFAAGGTNQVTDTFQWIYDLMQGAGVIVVSCAVGWAGYKMLFQRASIQEIAGPFIGALVIGCSATIAGILLGN